MTKAISAVSLIFATLVFATHFKESDEANILALCPLPSTSHMIFNTALPKELASRGHNVTIVTPFQPEKPIPNYNVIPIRKFTVEELMKQTDIPEEERINLFDLNKMNYIVSVINLWGFGELMCEHSLGEESIQNLMNSYEQFDLIIMESFFSECFIGFAHKFNAPVIQMFPFGGTENSRDLVGNPSPYAYVPDHFQEFSDKMSFTERVQNTLGYMIQKLAKKYFIRGQDASMRKHFNDSNMPSIEELEKKFTALVMVNHHFSISYAQPMVPNYMQVGGIHIKPPKKLPADLQKYLDDAPNGVIYFSMGSNLKSSDMPEATVNAFIKAFSKLKQKILWKWEQDSLTGQPPNLKLAKWLPQSDILAHPNVKLFITHGGLLSTQETILRGVPVIGIPIFGDQRLNMKRTEAFGYGKLLEFSNVSEESVTWAINEVLGNPKYRETVQQLSQTFRDQPKTPMETAVFWAEYIIRHKGAPHMRSAAMDLTWYQYFLLDVIAVLVLMLLFLLIFVFLLIRNLLKFLRRSSKSDTNVSAKKKIN